MAIGNKTLRGSRRCSTPISGARPAGADTLKPKTRSLYDGLLLVQERNSANTPAVTYTRGRDLSGSLAGAGGIGGLLARSHGYSGGNWSSHNAYHADGHGNVTALVNSAGALQASYRYDPYGQYLAGGGPLASANVLRFSSKPWVGFAGSATSGLYYYGYRFYDPYLQRWVNRDPIGELGGRNLYGFKRNHPTGGYDAHGLYGEGYDAEECAAILGEIDVLLNLTSQAGVDSNSIMRQVLDLWNEYLENCDDDDNGGRMDTCPGPVLVPGLGKSPQRTPTFQPVFQTGVVNAPILNIPGQPPCMTPAGQVIIIGGIIIIAVECILNPINGPAPP